MSWYAYYSGDSMDFSGVVVIGGSVLAGAVCGFLGGGIAGLIHDLALHVRVQSLEQKWQQINNKLASPMGVNARQEKAERMAEAVGKALVLLKTENAKPEDVLKQIASEYPDVAIDVAKKSMDGKNPLKGLF